MLSAVIYSVFRERRERGAVQEHRQQLQPDGPMGIVVEKSNAVQGKFKAFEKFIVQRGKKVEKEDLRA